ncbi:branched-chain amino acid ABC transporter substrate-binding protein [Rhizobium sp. ZPR3]|uniref:Branched-chain amino acid ABC transporter substrate-binding protein n=2 Tax=unclassified Rhizobium TaxID=2613769 RepID=A0AAU7SRP4_9HYPH
MRNHVLLATTFAASLAFVAPAQADFTIGIIAPLTGPGAGVGNKVKGAMQAAADEINKNGGILSDKLVLKFGDDASDPLKSSAVAKDFLDEKINFVIEAAVFDPPSPIQIRSESPSDILALAGTYVARLAKTSPPPELIDGGRTSNLSTACYRADPRQGVIAANYVLKNYKDKKIAIVDERTSYSTPLADAFKTTLNQGGVTEGLKFAVDPGAYDHTQEAEKLKQARVEVIYYAGSYEGIGKLARELGKSSIKPQIIGSDALSNVNYRALYKTEADGTIFTDAPRETVATDLQSARAALKEHEIPAEDLTLESYAAVQQLAAAIKDESCYGHYQFSLITDIKDGKPTVYLDPRAVAVRISADEIVPAETDKATGNRILPAYSLYVWKAGKIVPVSETRQGN